MILRKTIILLVVAVLVLAGLWLWILGIIPNKLPGYPGMRERVKEVIQAPPQLPGVAPLEKTVNELLKRRVAVRVSPEELRKKAEETAHSLSSWLEEQEQIDRMLVYHQLKRDPFLPVEKKEKTAVVIHPPKLVLRGVAWDKNGPMALINEQVVKEGDTIEGAKITRIYSDRVEIWYRSRKFTIKLVE